MPPSPIRCAIYTRKSTEEGLDQEFNSLDAQREACAAYITSQRHEGWQALPETYDDGGYSGGNINRPGLQRLLKDIQAGKVDVIVVYKIDRLTRSLADFAKMVELLDAQKSSFVSVTQQFNTTTSMGRLTLNVLLSFAQFEREVTGERIRDKLAASKAKGMWMGGNIPLGYDVKDRKLIINPTEAALVRHVFERYIELKSVIKLSKELNQQGYRTKSWTSRNGRVTKGGPFAIGHLSHILKNRLYAGDVVHKGKYYPGEHEAIVSHELWTQTQGLREENLRNYTHQVRAKERSLLSGKLFDAEGRVMSPSHSNKQGRRYRYYLSQTTSETKPSKPDTITRIPAGELEQAISDGIGSLLLDDERLVTSFPTLEPEQRHLAGNMGRAWKALTPLQRHTHLRDLLRQVTLYPNRLECRLMVAGLAKMLSIELEDGMDASLVIPIQLKRVARGTTLIFITPGRAPNPVLVRAIARAHWWNHLLVTGKARNFGDLSRQTGVHVRVIWRSICLAWLDSCSIESILKGEERANLTLAELMDDPRLGQR
jgi:DNA invertase Pin-like site-specific DNA recombinase